MDATDAATAKIDSLKLILKAQKMKTDLFFPPNVQRRFFELVPEKPTPRESTDDVHARMDALWARRSKCAETEIEDIDAEMLRIAVAVARNLPLPPDE